MLGPHKNIALDQIDFLIHFTMDDIQFQGRVFQQFLP